MGTVKMPGGTAVMLSACSVTGAMTAYLSPESFVVACDAGYRNAEKLGIVPDLVIGDFDSAPRPRETEIGEKKLIVLPHMKDDTDTHYAARWLLEQGCHSVTMLGALGGKRMEHTLANLATGLYLAKNGVEVVLADERSELHYLLPGRPLRLREKNAAEKWKYLSVFPLEGTLTGVTLAGVLYPLENAAITADYPLGVSNEFTAPIARLQCTAGCGLVVLTKADGEQEG